MISHFDWFLHESRTARIVSRHPFAFGLVVAVSAALIMTFFSGAE